MIIICAKRAKDKTTMINGMSYTTACLVLWIELLVTDEPVGLGPMIHFALPSYHSPACPDLSKRQSPVESEQEICVLTVQRAA